VGAWIEIRQNKRTRTDLLVAPLWVRGLKFAISAIFKYGFCRTLVGAWIEIDILGFAALLITVAPLWVRGLK